MQQERRLTISGSVFSREEYPISIVLCQPTFNFGSVMMKYAQNRKWTGSRSCNDTQVFRGTWDQTFTSGLRGLAPLPQVSLSTRLSINNSGLSIDLLVMSLQRPASGRSPDPLPRAGTSRRGGGRLPNN